MINLVFSRNTQPEKQGVRYCNAHVQAPHICSSNLIMLMEASVLGGRQTDIYFPNGAKGSLFQF